MTIHVNITEAKDRLASLVEASLRGEEVVIDHDGSAQVRLTPVPQPKKLDEEETRRKVAEILAAMDALPVLSEEDPLEWDENGLPI